MGSIWSLDHDSNILYILFSQRPRWIMQQDSDNLKNFKETFLTFIEG